MSINLRSTDGPAERRTQPRLDVDQPAKVYDPRARRYTGCRVRNISRGGAMIELPWKLPLSAGDHLMLGVMTGPEKSVLRTVEMMEVRVVRALGVSDSRMALGVHFEHEADVALNIARLAA